LAYSPVPVVVSGDSRPRTTGEVCMTVRLTTLGAPRVFLGEEELPSLPGKPVTFGLLVFLSVEREASKDRIMGVFWPEKDQEKARHALSQTLYELRQALGDDWASSSGPTVQVRESLWVDCLEFAQKAEEQALSEAVALYGGPFLDGVHLAQTNPFQHWVDGKRSRFGRRYRAAVDGFISECRTRGDYGTALKHAWRWAEMDPLDDGAQHNVIRLLAESGSRSEALAHFERYAKLLDTELGLEPLEEMVELVEAIRGGEVGTVEPESPAGPPAGHSLPEPRASETPSPEVSPFTWPKPTPAGTTEGGLPIRLDRDYSVDLLEADIGGDLEVLRPIAKGNMAEVFLAREPHLRRLVALKVLSSDLSVDGRARKRFEREAQAAARINHPNVCTVYRVGSLSNGTPFLVCPFVKGTTLAHRLKAEGRLDTDEVRRILREIASALAAAHKLGIIHRDVRPANVLRSDEHGRHSLCDFGISGVLETGDDPDLRLTKTGEILGNLAYISPEQERGAPLDDRTDIYSLGIVGYELLTGHFPPASESEEKKVMMAKWGRDTTFGRIAPLWDFLGERDPDLVNLIGACLATDPAQRPSAEDVERRLMEERRKAVREQEWKEISEIPLFPLILKKRIPHTLGAFMAGAWGAVEAMNYCVEEFGVPEWAKPLTWATIPFGFVAATIIAWFHGEKGRQEMDPVEKKLLWMLGLGWVVAGIWVVARYYWLPGIP